MNACPARPVYGVVELVALVVSILRPWLDAIRTEFTQPSVPSARPVPALQPEPAPQVEPEASPEPVADVPVVVEVVPVAVVELPTAVADVAETAALEYSTPVVDEAAIRAEFLAKWTPAEEPTEVLYVKKGAGRGARYAPAEPGDEGPRFRRRMIGTTRVSYVAV